MHIYLPDDNSGIRPILYFHAMARLGLEGMVVIEPAEPFISLGMFDNLDGAIDRAACQQHGIPIMRREIGGGTVLLGPGQHFYNLVLRRDQKRIPNRVSEASEWLSQIPMQAYRTLGLEVSYRPLTDLITDRGRKVSGQGSADIEGCFCFVGNILNHFDTRLMSQLFPCGDERERRLIHQSLEENMSWLAREQIEASPSQITHALIDAFRQQFGDVSEHPLPNEVLELVQELDAEFSSDEWLSMESNRSHNTLKIREGVYLHRHTITLNGEAQRLVILEEEQRIAQCLLGDEANHHEETLLSQRLIGQTYDPALFTTL